jgi:hypothetical protein
MYLHSLRYGREASGIFFYGASSYEYPCIIKSTFTHYHHARYTSTPRFGGGENKEEG